MEEDFTTVGGNNSVVFVCDQVYILDNIFVRAGLITVYSFIFLVSLLGNLAVILVVTLEWKDRLLSKFYLGNLATANFSVAIFCIPQNLSVYLLDGWIFGLHMCKMFHFVTSLCHAASILSLVVVSIERYIAVLHAFKGQEVLTVRRIKVVLVLLWLLSMGVSLPRFFYSELVQIFADDKGRKREICVPNTSMYNFATTDTIYFLALYAAPVALMSLIYLRISVRIRKFEKMRNALIGKEVHSRFLWEKNYGSRQMGNLDCTVTTYCGQTAPVHSITKRGSRRGRCRLQLKTLGPPLPGIKTSGRRLSRWRRQKRQSLVRMITLIVVTFALFNLPFHVQKFYVNFLQPSHMSSDLTCVISPFASVLMYANSAVNPFLYVLMSSRFRGSLRDLARKCSGARSRTADCI